MTQGPRLIFFIAVISTATCQGGLLRGASSSSNANVTTRLTSFDQTTALHALNLSQSTYCVDSLSSWTCPTCVDGVVLEAVIEAGGGRAIVGHDATSDSLFVAYRGSEDVENWIKNVQFFKTSPYDDFPNAKVETGFYKWHTSLNDGGLISALDSAASKFGTTKLSITGHSSGGAVATLFAFDIARGAVSGFTAASIQSVITFGSPRVGNSEFVEAHTTFGLPSFRVTHYHDMVPHVPEEMMGYQHVDAEIWFNEPSSSYLTCSVPGEDGSCSNSCGPLHCTSIDDHLNYMNITLGHDDGC